jgi:hypothetical protein
MKIKFFFEKGINCGVDVKRIARGASCAEFIIHIKAARTFNKEVDF